MSIAARIAKLEAERRARADAARSRDPLTGVARDARLTSLYAAAAADCARLSAPRATRARRLMALVDTALHRQAGLTFGNLA